MAPEIDLQRKFFTFGKVSIFQTNFHTYFSTKCDVCLEQVIASCRLVCIQWYLDLTE
ncbi:hypothetical protein RchiOBHm_Chr3g0490561 [Rosa chinensis]|uniref:Uncharacterized protein n=1 Tax=Rosa chinensis TaxID=74649 RepID=A0A2P6RG09_ROSCH|nr:hypothetical protein RchiOBHm_Chr3g0490561 [Rosa chinensis]